MDLEGKKRHVNIKNVARRQIANPYKTLRHLYLTKMVSMAAIHIAYGLHQNFIRHLFQQKAIKGRDITGMSLFVRINNCDFKYLQGIGSGKFLLQPGVTIPKHLISSTPPTSLTILEDFLCYQFRKRHTVTGDGNCFFRACSHQLYSTEVYHSELRQSLQEYIQDNYSKYEIYWLDCNLSYSDHVQQLKTQGTWATQLELQAFCDSICLPIFVCSPNVQTRAYCWGKFTPSTHNRNAGINLPLSGLPFTVDHLEIAHSSTRDHYDSIVQYRDQAPPLQAPAITPRLVASIDLIS